MCLPTDDACQSSRSSEPTPWSRRLNTARKRKLRAIIVLMKTFKADLSVSEKESLKRWGDGLRARRIERLETQVQTAKRLGVSVSAYRRMEGGHPTTSVGLWIRAFALFRVLPDLDAALEPSLFSDGLGRRRVRKRTSWPR